MKPFTKYMIAVLVGVVIGSIPTFFLTRAIYNKLCPPCEKEIKDHVTTTTISGKPGTIKHSNWNFKGTAVCFETKSTGIGKIKTNIDKNLIPEAHKWMTYKHGLGLDYTGLVIDQKYNHVFGVDYLHRWNWFSIGFGPRLTYYEDIINKRKIYGGGFNIKAQVWFKGI